MAEPIAEDFAAIIEAASGEGWARAMGLKLVRATRDEVVAEMVIQTCHLQAYGIVHGGVYAGIIESLASIGAAIHAMSEGRSVVGLENTTSFLRATREGTLHAVATPLSRGRRSPVWECAIRDDKQRLVATGRVRLLVLEPGADIAGAKAAVSGGE
ncbi:MAG: PaaI family thioesterase [Byssovorax sp.]